MLYKLLESKTFVVKITCFFQAIVRFAKPGQSWNPELLAQRCVGQDNDGVTPDQIPVQAIGEARHRDVTVELGQLRAARIGPVSADVGLGEVEVGREVADRHVGDVVQLDWPEICAAELIWWSHFASTKSWLCQLTRTTEAAYFRPLWDLLANSLNDIVVVGREKK